ncbi:MAG: hypothetical protein ACLRSE_11250 [Alistipes finegoldii]
MQSYASSRRSRGRWRSSGSLRATPNAPQSPDSLVGVGAAGRAAGAGGRSRHDLFHPARIRERDLAIARQKLRPAARIGGP